MNTMIFLTFHHEGDEIKIKLDAFMGFRTYADGSHAIYTHSGAYLFVDEDFEYFVGQMRKLEEVQEASIRQAMIGANVTRKFNGQG